MNMDRINRWKCLLCGSKLKKIIDLKDAKDMVIGYSLHCCNCGHLDNVALNMKAIDTMTGYEGKANDRVISCGVSIHNIDACAFKECPFRKKENKFEENEKSTIKDPELSAIDEIPNPDVEPIEEEVSKEETLNSKSVDTTTVSFLGDASTPVRDLNDLNKLNTSNAPSKLYASKMLSDIIKPTPNPGEMVIPVRKQIKPDGHQ